MDVGMGLPMQHGHSDAQGGGRGLPAQDAASEGILATILAQHHRLPDA